MSKALDIRTINGGITTPQGFRAAGVSAGIKAHGLDLALLVSDRPATAAAVFTTNRAQAAPVVVSRDHLQRSGGIARAIVVNSGCANACTGDAGLRIAREMAAETGQLIACPVEHVLVSSTGVIGVALDIDKIRRALPAAMTALGRRSGRAGGPGHHDDGSLSEGSCRASSLGGGAFAIGGMAKGSGMIEPNMATMLAFVTTDAAVLRRSWIGRFAKPSTRRSTRSPSTVSARRTTA